MYPAILEKSIEYFKKFPGVGEKTAERMALFVVDLELNEVREFSQTMKVSKETLKACAICGHLTDEEECCICINKMRKDNLICVVEDFRSVFVFEKTGNFEGKYHVLNGLISPIEKIGPDDINIHSLYERCKKIEGPIELIIALKPTIEGDATTLYIKKIFEKLSDKSTSLTISRLSYGIPMGAEIDYIDTVTLGRALQDRKTIS